ncbi:MAG: DUF1566 domain-containing protein [Treponema sp.]|nr:DUF1566 domain-containing protein [Treponema sp.]
MKKLFAVIIMAMGMIFTLSAERRLAVASFDITGNAVTKDEAEAITELYITELVTTGKVKVVDRMNFDKILKEMNFQNSDWSDKEKTAELGKVANADLIARGQIIKLGSKMYLSATIIDVKSANVLSSARKDFNSIDDIFGLLTSFAKDAVAGLDLKIGDIGPGGGIVFYIEGKRCLECSDLLGEATWKDAKAMCKNYRGGGYSDWYLPTKEELNYIYQNLRMTGKIGGDTCYWSSSSYINLGNAWEQRFSDGYQYHGTEYDTYSVRAIRAFNN